MSARRKVPANQLSRKMMRSISLSALPWRDYGQVLLVTTLLLALLAVAWLGLQRLAERTQQPITEVIVHGDFRHLQQDAIRHAVATVMQGSFFTIDMQQIHAAVLDIPWVATASVRRIWPSTLLLQVEEHEHALRWGEEKLVSRRGDIFSPDDIVPFQHLVQLHAADNYREELLHEYRRIGRLLMPFGKIDYMERSARGSWTLRLDTGLTIDLGSNGIEQRLQRVVRFMRHLNKQLEMVAHIDARYSNGVAVIVKKLEDSMQAGASAV